MLSCQTHNYGGNTQQSPNIFCEDVALTIVSFLYIFNCLKYILFFEMESLYITSEFIFIQIARQLMHLSEKMKCQIWKAVVVKAIPYRF